MNYSEIIILTARSRGTRGVMGFLGLYGLLGGDLGHSRLVSLRFRPRSFCIIIIIIIIIIIFIIIIIIIIIKPLSTLLNKEWKADFLFCFVFLFFLLCFGCLVLTVSERLELKN